MRNDEKLNYNNITYLEALKLLSPQEVKVLDFVLMGMTTKEIADELFLSVGTILTHKRNICRKLNIKGRQGLLQWGIKQLNDLYNR